MMYGKPIGAVRDRMAAGVQPPPPNRNLKTQIHDLRLSVNQRQKSADDWYIGILKNITILRMCKYVFLFQLFLGVPLRV